MRLQVRIGKNYDVIFFNSYHIMFLQYLYYNPFKNKQNQYLKLPFFIPIGAPLSIAWMFGNMFFALKIAFKKLKEKNIEPESQKRIFLAIMAIGIIYLILDTNFYSKIALMVISFPIIWVYARKGYKVIKK